MSTSVARPLGAMERVLIGGDLSRLSEQERLDYYKATCESLGLNPLTKPFSYLHLNGKLQLYAMRDCTDQLRKIHVISVKIVSREVVEGVYVVTSQAKTPEGREDESIGAVPLGDDKQNPLKPADRANAMMKAETKAKRRVTLSICGLGMLDESELDTISNKVQHVEQPQQIEASTEPDGLLNLLTLVDDKRGVEALKIMEAKLKALGPAGLGCWEARIKAMKSNGKNIPGSAIKECLRGLWADGASLEASTAADAPNTGQFEDGWQTEEEPKA